MAQEKKQPLLIIVGPTASGKTRLGVAMAKALSGEVISADSMQMYRRMNIATAKPTAEEMEGVPHHLMDFLEPDQSFPWLNMPSRTGTVSPRWQPGAIYLSWWEARGSMSTPSRITSPFPRLLPMRHIGRA